MRDGARSSRLSSSRGQPGARARATDEGEDHADVGFGREKDSSSCQPAGGKDLPCRGRSNAMTLKALGDRERRSSDRETGGVSAPAV